ncbi:MAG: hypothetical protein HON23_00890 [Rickettsiales bacterium]|jgi:hypothetical protein|nr:hypothetical protein [Rickettsiales bacterium]
MTKHTDLKKELDYFKAKMQEVNQSLDSIESVLKIEQNNVYNLRHSFADMIKLINGELIQSFDNNTQLLVSLSKDKV